MFDDRFSRESSPANSINGLRPEKRPRLRCETWNASNDVLLRGMCIKGMLRRGACPWYWIDLTDRSVGFGSLVPDLNLQGTKHLRNGGFFPIDPQNIVQNECSRLVAGMNDQPSAPQQQVFEDVVDLFADSQIGSRISLEAAQEAMMMQKFIRSNFPIIESDVNKYPDIDQSKHRCKTDVKRRIGQRFDFFQHPCHGWKDGRYIDRKEQKPHTYRHKHEEHD